MLNNRPNNRKRRPTHPGEILREDVLPAAGLTQDKLARLLGVSRRTVSEILHERRTSPPTWRTAWRAPSARRPRCGLGCSRVWVSGTSTPRSTRRLRAHQTGRNAEAGLTNCRSWLSGTDPRAEQPGQVFN